MPGKVSRRSDWRRATYWRGLADATCQSKLGLGPEVSQSQLRTLNFAVRPVADFEDACEQSFVSTHVSSSTVFQRDVAKRANVATAVRTPTFITNLSLREQGGR